MPTQTTLFRTFLFLFILALLVSCTRPPLPPPVVLFEQGHGQKSLIENTEVTGLSMLAEKFKKQNFKIKASRTQLTKELLQDISTLIISGPTHPLTGQEIEAVMSFLNGGGQMCIMLDNVDAVSQLLGSLNVAVSNGIIREQANLIASGDLTDFLVSDLAPHPLTKEVKQIRLDGAWALNTQLEANVLAKTSPKAWIDLNNDNKLDHRDAKQAFSVIITGQLGHGHFLIFGNDSLFQNHSLDEQNSRLAENLAKWLKAGSYY